MPESLLRVAVAEDEPLTRAQLVRLLEGQPGVEVVGEATSGREAVDLVRQTRPDLLLLDVQMPGLTGLEALDRLAEDGAPLPAVVFVTAYDHHAVRAFELHALDYVVKPFDDERLALAVERARTRIQTGRLAHFGRRMAALVQDGAADADPGRLGDLALAPGHPERLAVRTGGRIDLVRVSDIDWVEGCGVYARLHVGGRKHLLRETLARLEDQLPARRFARIHRSTIVNLDRVQSLDHLTRGEYVVYLHDGTQLKLSRSYRDRLQDLLGTATD
jgi:two-component system LytT family response regulator